MNQRTHNDQPKRRRRSALREIEPVLQPSEDESMKKRVELIPDDLYDADIPLDTAHEDEVSGGGGGSDDALGLYLKQMGAIPLLNREKELALAQQLEIARSRYRRSVLFSWWSLQRVIGMFDQIQEGLLPLDPHIDVVHSLGLHRESILARLPVNLITLHKMFRAAGKDFAAFQRARTPSARIKMQRQRRRQIRKGIRLIEELSPRTEWLDALWKSWTWSSSSCANLTPRWQAITADRRRSGIIRRVWSRNCATGFRK